MQYNYDACGIFIQVVCSAFHFMLFASGLKIVFCFIIFLFLKHRCNCLFCLDKMVFFTVYTFFNIEKFFYYITLHNTFLVDMISNLLLHVYEYQNIHAFNLFISYFLS